MERILLVSATEKSRTMLSQFLTSCGVQAQLAPASSGAEARRMLVDGLFDLILVNTPLPDEFGHDMAQQIRFPVSSYSLRPRLRTVLPKRSRTTVCSLYPSRSRAYCSCRRSA